MPRTNDRLPANLERQLRRAARARDRADGRYRELIGQALSAGWSQAAVGRAVGLTRAAINKIRPQRNPSGGDGITENGG